MTPAEFALPQARRLDRRTPVRWIVSHARPYWWLVVGMLLGAFGNAALAMLVPVYIGQAFNAILEHPPRIAVLGPIALLITGSQILRGALQLARNFGAEMVGQRVERDIREELYLSLLGKSMTFHNLQPIGDTMARATNDVREINLLFSPGLNLVIGSAFFLVMPILYAPRYYPSLIITPLVFTILYFIVLVRYLKTLSPITDEVRSTFGEMNTHLSESLDGVETVKGAAQENEEVDKFVLNATRVRNWFVKQGDTEARFVGMLLLGLAYAAGLTQALLLFRQGILSVGDVVAYFGILRLLEFPTFTSTWAYTQVSLGVSGARRILELMNRETRLDQNVAGFSQPIRGEIEFRNVTFTYPDSNSGETGGAPVLEEISFKVKPGQTVAIVGQTGAGKTTIARLINRTYDLGAGEVLVDGVDVRHWDLAALRRQISIIEQDVFLFSRTIAENIAFGRKDATPEQIEAAARAAQAHEFILGFEQGYQTVIGERGVTLSGGQRQRLALARAFLTDPRILILDDSTSSIDSATEDQIQRAIFRAAQGRTTIIITHRLSQIRWADQILVLRRGRLVAAGSHAGLMQTSDAYRRIFSRYEEGVENAPSPQG